MKNSGSFEGMSFQKVVAISWLHLFVAQFCESASLPKVGFLGAGLCKADPCGTGASKGSEGRLNPKTASALSQTVLQKFQ